MFRHVRSKLIAAFTVPLALLILAGGVETASSLSQINSVDLESALASASVGPGGVVNALQLEREYAILTIFENAKYQPIPLGGGAFSVGPEGLAPYLANLDQTPKQLFAGTDAAVRSFESTVYSSGAQARRVYSKAFASLGDLGAVRKGWAAAAAGKTVSDYEAAETQTFRAYTVIIDSLVSATSEAPAHISDPVLRTGVEALYANLAETESTWQVVQDLLVCSWSPGTWLGKAIDATTEDWGWVLTWEATLNDFGLGTYGQAVNTLDESQVGSEIDSDIQLMQFGASARGLGTPPLMTVWDALTTPAVGTSGPTALALGDEEIASVVAHRVEQLHRAALERLLLFAGLSSLGAVLGFLLIFLVSRSISDPLVKLAHQAEVLAAETLPATVQAILEASGTGTPQLDLPEVVVDSRDEVAGVAEALRALNTAAVKLAVGQATLRRNLASAFVDVGLRNHKLVNRQLEYINEIEMKEADPRSLEELFRLDHIATRMRRNAESLLILAGGSRQEVTPGPTVMAMDIARAASAEVEEYGRLRLHHFDPANIAGGVTLDLVHILAELMENALTFSPPESPVDVYGRMMGDDYLMVIVDRGIGMSAKDLEAANLRLRAQGAGPGVPGRYLGHFVAGRLAGCHGISLSLNKHYGPGLVARVEVPARFVEEAATEFLNVYATGQPLGAEVPGGGAAVAASGT